MTLNFSTAAELAALLGNRNSVNKSSYQEGNDHNIYTYGINREWLLAVVFGTQIKPGVVWFYTKQTAEAILSLSQESRIISPDSINQPPKVDFVSELTEVIDTSLEEKPASNNGDNGIESNISAKHITERPKALESTVEEEIDGRPMTFEEAVSAGLVPKHILHRESAQ